MTKRVHITAVVPCKNGQGSIARTVGSLSNEVLVDEVVVIDDGSSDSTATEAEAAGARVLSLEHNLGKGAAMRAGVAAAPHADVFLFVDADTKDTAGHAVALLEPILAGEVDLAIGVLPSAGAKGGFGTVKKIAVRGIERACGFTSSAPLSGQRAASAGLIKELTLADGFAVEVAMTIDAVRKGAVVREIAVDMDHHHRGRSFGGFWHRGKQGLAVLQALWPRLVPASLRMGFMALLALLVLGALVNSPGSRVEPAAALPKSDNVRIVIVPGWLWPESGNTLSSAAGASVVTGDIDDVVNAVASGSRDPEAQPLSDVEVEVQPAEQLAVGDPTNAEPGTVVISAGVTTKGKDAALRPLVVAGNGIKGTLVSTSTRSEGLVDLVDLAPTVLQMEGKPIPASAQGAPLSVDVNKPVDQQALSRADSSAQFYKSNAPKIIVAYVLFQCALGLTGLWFVRAKRDLAPLMNSALAVAAFPLAAYLITAFLGTKTSLFAWSALVAVAVGIIVFMSNRATSNRARNGLRGVVALQRILLATVVVLVGDLCLGGSLQYSGVFGSSPLLGTRFYGLGNPATTLLLLAVVLWSAIHVQRSANRSSSVKTAAFLMGTTALAIGLPNLGADAGGLVAGAMTVVVAVALLARQQFSPLRVAGLVGGAFAVCAIAAFADSQRGVADQTHLGRLFDGGGTELADAISRRLDTNVFGYGFPWTLGVVALAAMFTIGLVQGRWQRTIPLSSAQRSGVIAATTATLLVYALNDSGIVVLTLAAVYVAPFLMAEHSASKSKEVPT